jgi:hypothetical protein
MQSEFKNKIVLPKKTCEVHFITSLNIFAVARNIIRTFTDLDKGSLPISLN